MRKLPLAALGLLAAVAMANVVFVGCGSEGDSAIPDADGGDEGTVVNPNPDTGTNPGLDGGTDAFITTIDGSRADAAVCSATGATCAKSTECCTANCNATTGKCEAPNTLCKVPGKACLTGNECCTFSCIAGSCSSLQCVADNLACANDNECCGGKCAPDGLGGGKCTPLNPGGKPTSGNPCVANGDCASKFCNNGICASPSFCGQTNDVCSAGSECCGGICTKAAGSALGICALPGSGGGCSVAGIVCPIDNPPAVCGGACCSKSCAPYGPTGVPVCQPESGCRIPGNICMKDADCCGALGAPGSQKGGDGGKDVDTKCTIAVGATVGRCDNGNACEAAGAVCKLDGISCSTSTTCCAGNSQQFPTCKQDALGIPRCTALSNYDCTVSGPPAPGTGCASTADCCGGPCVPNPAGGQPAFICASACVASGGTCSSTADCCPGLPCAIPPGASKGICGGVLNPDGGVAPPPDGGGVVTQDGGTAGDGGVCALYGQGCTAGSTTQCCSGVPCTGAAGSATCRFP